MLVSVCVSGSKFVMNVLGYRKRRQQEQKTDEADGKPSGEPACWKKPSHNVRLDYHSDTKGVKERAKDRLFCPSRSTTCIS